jgi:hypothetical protein
MATERNLKGMTKDFQLTLLTDCAVCSVQCQERSCALNGD